MVPGKHIVTGSSPVGEGESRPQDWTRGANRGVPWLLENGNDVGGRSESWIKVRMLD